MRFLLTLAVAVATITVLAFGPACAELQVIDHAVNPVTGHWYGLIADYSVGSSPSGVTWFNAENFAVNSLGIHLVTIDSIEENQWVFDRFLKWQNRCLWLGLNDAAADNDYRWVANDSPIAIPAPWYPGEPNDYLTGGQDYVMMLSGDWSSAGLWNDSFGDVTVFPYGPLPSIMGLAEDVVPEPAALTTLTALISLAAATAGARRRKQA